jgi:transposase-like protein
MTRRIENQELSEGQGLFLEKDALARLLEPLVRHLLEEEISRFIGAGYYERNTDRKAHRNGTKPRTMKTRVGELQFDIPQVREGGFKSSLFERYQRGEKALLCAFQEMYIQGVSTRRVSEVMESMCGFEVSAGQVSRATAELDEEIKRFRGRRLDEHSYPYLIVDARYEKIRRNGSIISQAVMIVSGITDSGYREILGFQIGDSESEATWSEVFKDLKARGLSGVRMIVSDAHKGITAAIKRHLQGVPWQRCRVHFTRELTNKASWRDRKDMIKDFKSIYASEEKAMCLKTAKEVAEKWEKRYPAIANALQMGVEDTLTVLALPSSHRRRLHSTNMMERLMKTLKARTRVVSIFPNTSSCDRLIGALLIEKHEDWLSETKRYLNMEIIYQ